MAANAELVFLHKPDWSEVDVHKTHNGCATWITMNPSGRPCFTSALLDEINRAQARAIHNDASFVVLSSNRRDVFNYGGDLNHFHELISRQDKAGLVRYMKQCIDVIAPTQHYQAKPYRIALVQGSAFGGGFEAALCCNTIIAEEQARFAFPEILFNLFPGMGAYHNLLRRVHPAAARKLIESGDEFEAMELLELGVVNEVVPKGEGHNAVHRFISNYMKRENGYGAINEIIQQAHPVSRDTLYQVGELWAERALNLSPRDMRMIESLVKAQNRAEAARAGAGKPQSTEPEQAG